MGQEEAQRFGFGHLVSKPSSSHNPAGSVVKSPEMGKIACTTINRKGGGPGGGSLKRSEISEKWILLPCRQKNIIHDSTNQTNAPNVDQLLKWVYRGSLPPNANDATLNAILLPQFYTLLYIFDLRRLILQLLRYKARHVMLLPERPVVIPTAWALRMISTAGKVDAVVTGLPVLAQRVIRWVGV